MTATLLAGASAAIDADSARPPRVLVCPPDYFGIEYEINPWMSVQRGAIHELALRQWQALIVMFQRLGAELEFLTAQPGLPDMVFTANAGLVFRDEFIPSRFRHPQRQGETEIFERKARELGFRIHRLPEGMLFEGAGDALFCGDTLVGGYLHRSDRLAHESIGRRYGCPVLSVELVDARFYHLDTCFCPLADGVALYYPPAFDEYGRQALTHAVPQLIAVDDEDAIRFACNAVVLGRNVVMNGGSDRIMEQLGEAGFDAHFVNLSEFLKAGGAAKCLTLRLDGEAAAGWRRRPPLA